MTVVLCACVRVCAGEEAIGGGQLVIAQWQGRKKVGALKPDGEGDVAGCWLYG